MTTRILTMLRPRPFAVALGVGISSFVAFRHHAPSRLLLRCDASPGVKGEFGKYQREAQVPVVGEGGRLNPRAVRQISAGSIGGFLSGLAVSIFSKPLAVLIGLLVLGVQSLESRGLHIIPYSWIQRYFSNTDIRSAIQDNVAFKLSFGLTFALAGFMEF